MKENLLHESNDWHFGRSIRHWSRLGMMLFLLVGAGIGGCFEAFASNGNVVDYYKQPIGEKGQFVHETHYDYSEVARVITSGCTTDYEKIRAIYQWLCANISYDTSYTIRTADQCFDAKRGVCQGYCELFYQIAKAAGVTAEIVGGKSKNQYGVIGQEGHSWIFAYTRPDYGILLDPTWGAGSVEGQTFTRRKDCWSWFNVDPEWMLLSHFPDDASYQLISNPITLSEFVSMPPVDHLWVEYGLDAHMLYEKTRSRQLEMPRFYTRGEGEFRIIDMPMRKSLQVGETYTFRIKMNSGRDFTIINNKVFSTKNEWKNEGGGVYSINYMVRDTERLAVSIWDAADNMWWTMMDYQVEQPSRANWEKVEKRYPLSSPDAINVKNLDGDDWEQAGVNGHRLLQLIRESGTRELPILYLGKGQKLKIESVPMKKSLQAGTAYTFLFKPLSGRKWALINGDKWYQDWRQSADGTFEITIRPEKADYLRLSVQLEDGGSYWSCLEYDVR